MGLNKNEKQLENASRKKLCTISIKYAISYVCRCLQLIEPESPAGRPVVYYRAPPYARCNFFPVGTRITFYVLIYTPMESHVFSVASFPGK